MMNQNAATTRDLVLTASGFSAAGTRCAALLGAEEVVRESATVAEGLFAEDSSFLPLMIVSFSMSCVWCKRKRCRVADLQGKKRQLRIF